MTAAAESAIKIVRPDRLAHVVLRTQQLRPMVEWWKTVLQAQVAFENDFLSFMTFDDEHHRVAIAQIPKLADAVPHAVGLDHIAFTYASLDDLVYTYERLKDEGIETHWVINHGPTLSIYYKDPDGNQAELQIDRFETPEEATAFFNSESFRKHPIGHSVDIADLARRYHAGESHASLIAYPVDD
jgi:catechol-2,3-dioxygenase